MPNVKQDAERLCNKITLIFYNLIAGLKNRDLSEDVEVYGIEGSIRVRPNIRRWNKEGPGR